MVKPVKADSCAPHLRIGEQRGPRHQRPTGSRSSRAEHDVPRQILLGTLVQPVMTVCAARDPCPMTRVDAGDATAKSVRDGIHVRCRSTQRLTGHGDPVAARAQGVRALVVDVGLPLRAGQPGDLGAARTQDVAALGTGHLQHAQNAMCAGAIQDMVIAGGGSPPPRVNPKG